MYQLNDVIKWGSIKYRILYLSPIKVVLINIDNEDSLPEIAPLDEFDQACLGLAVVRADDPYGVCKKIVTNSLSETILRKRDTALSLISNIIKDEMCFDPVIRSERINILINERLSTKKTLYKYLKKYWQRGQVPNALLPDYNNSGARGKKRTPGNKKLGRPRVYSSGEGANIDEFIEKLFRRMIDKHYLSTKRHSISYAYRRFLEFYQTQFPEIKKEDIPTITQMKYFFNREYNTIESFKKRIVKTQYNKDHRPLSSTANTQVLGPGSRYEIDATIADIYLVSNTQRRNIVGRPTIYTVIDVFSRMVTGVYIGLESPSYVAAMQTLINAMTDKTEYCKQFGIHIENTDWPVSGLPDAILADRGELIGYQIESLEKSFGVRIENTPPYRGDAKGIVERRFRTIQASFKPHAPGVVTNNMVRKTGGSDYRLDAKLTIDEFTEIILEAVLYHNNHHVLTKYDRDADMPTNLEMTPLSLWNWGLKNRTGRLRSASVEAITVALLPRDKATISNLGLCFFGLYYTGKEMISAGWLHRQSTITRPKKLTVAYDPRTTEQIYLFHNESSEYWTCKLAPRSREFTGATFWDVWNIKSEQKKSLAKSKLESESRLSQLERKIEEKIKQASKLSSDTGMSSKAERIRAIKPSRDISKNDERSASAFHPSSHKNQDSHAMVIPITNETDDLSFPSYIDELFDDEDNK